MAPVRTVLANEIAMPDAVRAEASEASATAHDRRVQSITLHLEDGGTIQLPGELSRFLADVLRSAATGERITTRTLPEELTTTTAAQEIGVSRPTLMKMIADGKLRAHKVGTHTRLRRDDVLEVRSAMIARRERAAIELLRAGEAFD